MRKSEHLITECPNCGIDLMYGDNLFNDFLISDYFWQSEKDTHSHFVTLPSKCPNCNKGFKSVWKHEKNITLDEPTRIKTDRIIGFE